MAIIFSLFSLSAFAAYQVDVKLASNGNTLNEGRLILNEGDEGSIAKDNSFIEVVATPHSNGIALTIVSGMMNEDGSRTVVTNSELVVGNGKTAVKTIGTMSNPSETITLTVTPKIIPTPTSGAKKHL